MEHVGPNKVVLVTIITGQDNHRHHHNDGTRVACDREAVTTHLGADLQLPKHPLMNITIIIIIIIIIIFTIVIIIVTRPSLAFGRLGLGGSSGGYSSCG